MKWRPTWCTRVMFRRWRWSARQCGSGTATSEPPIRWRRDDGDIRVFLNEFNDYVAGVLRRELSARRHAELTFNIFNVRLDPEAGLATVQDELDRDRSEAVDLSEFARMVEERTQN